MFLLFKDVTNLNLLQTNKKISNLKKIKNINNSRKINGPEKIENIKEMKKLYTNINGIPNKIVEIENFIKIHNFNIIYLTQTHLNSNILDTEVTIENLMLFRRDRDYKLDKSLSKNEISLGGGSATYVHKEISCNVVQLIANESGPSNELLKHYNITLICAYRSMSLNREQNNSLASNIMNILNNPYNEVVIVGDFNLPNMNWTTGHINTPEFFSNRILNTHHLFSELFNGLHWYFTEEKTRHKLVRNLQES